MDRSKVGPAVGAIALMLAACSGSAGTTTAANRAEPPTSTVAKATTSPPTSSTLGATSTTLVPSTTTTGGPDALWDTWTLIYASLDTSLHAREQAEALAGDIEGGLVLLSDDYPSLNPGYWVVHAGQWGSSRAAGAMCPQELDPALSCYPRYLGDESTVLPSSGSALAYVDFSLVVLDATSGEVQRTITDTFGGDGVFPGNLALDRNHDRLFYGIGFEDSWYSCETEPGFVRQLDLGSGTSDSFVDGWAPAVSPDGRWLAVVAASRCVPDPAQAGWVMAPGDTVELYDLESNQATPSHTLALATPPADYDDSNQILAVLWEADSKSLLIGMADDTVRSVPIDSKEPIEATTVALEYDESFPAAVTLTHSYHVLPLDDGWMRVTEVDRITGETSWEYETVGYWTCISVNSEGKVLIGGSDALITPRGEAVPIEGTIYSLAW